MIDFGFKAAEGADANFVQQPEMADYLFAVGLESPFRIVDQTELTTARRTMHIR